MKHKAQRPATMRPAPSPRRSSALPLRSDGHHQPTAGELARSVIEGRWTILGSVAVALAIAGAYLYVARPVYRSSALVHVDERPEGTSRLEDLSALLEPHASTVSEIELMRSRHVIGSVVDELRLDLEARPRRFPILGGALARRYAGAAPAAPPLGLSRLAPFAWGGERITVTRLVVPARLLDEPLTLVALPHGAYRLRGPDGAVLAEGHVGDPAPAAPAADAVALAVSELVARPGTEFVLQKRRREEVVTSLRKRLYVAEQGPGHGRGTGVVALELQGDDPELVARILATLCDTYVKENVERSSAQAAKTLAFLEAQLPHLKTNLERAEAALNTFRRGARTVDLPIESRVTVERAADLDRIISDLESTRTQLRQRYGDAHPDVVQVERQLAAARTERSAFAPRIETLPTTQLASARLTRDVSVATDLYLTLLNRAQELRVVKSGRTGSVRVVDRPFAAHRPDHPKVPSVLALSILLGLVGGVALTLARRAFDQKVEDPREIEQGTGLPVFLSVPHSDRERRRADGAPLAAIAPDDVATETLRALRSSLAFVLKDRPRVLAVSSPSPGVGKTFVCANLAHLFAASGQRVLVVDADLRRGTLHRVLGGDAHRGLSDVVKGEVALADAIRATDTPGLELLPCGTAVSSPAELLGGPRLGQLLDEAAKRYDVVLVDTPPILAVADAIAVARHATLNVLVLRARHHALDEIALAIERFTRAGIRVQGGILNDVRPAGAPYARVYEHRAAGALGG
ncbi:MAG TPA: polysaccharide biosynthesis tyrosine autokinase [Anaeromyxobacter sp.]|nr:polysaccharide biosynthesis tyrosine autokinase [Anaeromyxobacter sp.]